MLTWGEGKIILVMWTRKKIVDKKQIIDLMVLSLKFKVASSFASKCGYIIWWYTKCGYIIQWYTKCVCIIRWYTKCVCIIRWYTKCGCIIRWYIKCGYIIQWYTNNMVIH